MKLRRITPILVLALILPACSDNQSSDRVEVTQPPAPDGIDEENIADPFASDEGLQAAYAACKVGT